jgi:hypothetical protein
MAIRLWCFFVLADACFQVSKFCLILIEGLEEHFELNYIYVVLSWHFWSLESLEWFFLWFIVFISFFCFNYAWYWWRGLLEWKKHVLEAKNNYSRLDSGSFFLGSFWISNVTTWFSDLWPAHRQGSPPRFHTFANPNLHTSLSFK